MANRKILVVRTDRLGDVILTTPLLRALRQTFPQATIAAMVRSYARPLLENNPHIDEIITDDPDSRDAGRTGFWKQVRLLRSRGFDTALLLLPTERAAWMLFLAGIRTRIGVGHKLYEHLTLMRTVSRHKYIPLRHEADYCLDLGRAIGVRTDDLSTEVFLTDAERIQARQGLDADRIPRGAPLFGIHPGSGHSSPNWTIERYAEFAAEFVRRTDAFIVVTGSEAERDFQNAFQAVPAERIRFRFGGPLRSLMALIAQYNVFISASTGPMHIAAALDVPTFSLFCPLPACSPVLWGPKGNRSAQLVAADTQCQVTCERDPHHCTMSGTTVTMALEHFNTFYETLGGPKGVVRR